MNKKTERKQNLSLMIETLRRYGAMPQARLKEYCGIQASTVSYLVSDLRQAGLVKDSGQVQAEGKVGKPGNLLQLDNERASFLGLYLEDDWIDAYLIGIDGTTMDYEKVEFREMGIRETIFQLVGRKTSEWKQICGVGIAVKAIVHNDGTIRSDKRSDGEGHTWNIAGLADELKAAFPGLSMVVENDANCAAELYCYETGCGTGSLVVYLLNQQPFGIGCGLMVGGRIFRGNTGSAGEYFEKNSKLRDLEYHVGREGEATLRFVQAVTPHIQTTAYLLDPECIVLSGSCFKTLTGKEKEQMETLFAGNPVPVRVACGSQTLDPARGAALLAVNAYTAGLVEEVTMRS